MINFYCMDRIENLHREHLPRPLVTLQRPQQQQRQQHYDDSNRLIDSSLTLKSVLLWRSSDDLTTSNKDDVISPIKIVSHTITRSCFNFKLIFLFLSTTNKKFRFQIYVFFFAQFFFFQSKNIKALLFFLVQFIHCVCVYTILFSFFVCG